MKLHLRHLHASRPWLTNVATTSSLLLRPLTPSVQRRQDPLSVNALPKWQSPVARRVATTLLNSWLFVSLRWNMIARRSKYCLSHCRTYSPLEWKMRPWSCLVSSVVSPATPPALLQMFASQIILKTFHSGLAAQRTATDRVRSQSNPNIQKSLINLLLEFKIIKGDIHSVLMPIV